VDLGLRLEDVKELGLQSEFVRYSGKVDPSYNLKSNGATEEECEFLVQETEYAWEGQRVELNAMTSRQFIDWLEAKLQKHGVTKIVPNNKTLNQAYRRAVHLARIQEAIDEAVESIKEEKVVVPRDLQKRLKAMLKKTERSWDAVLWEIVSGEPDEDQ
jgi:hypothetical protein